jgi:uncharacterized protein (DUF302 family)
MASRLQMEKTSKKGKLDVEFRKYVILGACNPPNAHQAILAEENFGLMLPCNVIIYERGNKIVLSIIRPTVAMQMIANPALGKVIIQCEISSMLMIFVLTYL